MSDKKEAFVLTDDIRAALAPEFAKLEAAAKEAGIKEGAETERKRILAIEDAAIPGHDQLVAEMKADGTTLEVAQGRLLVAEKTKRKDKLADLRDESIAAAPATTVANPGKKEAPAPKVPSTEKEIVAQSSKLAKEAQVYQSEQAKEGNVISISDATLFVYERAGVPLK